jgi:quercetin dioxygenase-like cupin family protein
VLLHVVEGAGTFCGEGSEARLAAGGTVVYAPGEEHAIAAGDGVLRFLAVIAPRP